MMKGAKITTPTGRKFALVARSGSYAVIWQALPSGFRAPANDEWHPINATTDTIGSPLGDGDEDGLCCLVRDPIERFRSACARQQVTVEEGLARTESDVHFWPLEFMGLLKNGVTYFKFPAQIDACAEWLGLATPVPQLNEEPESAKPTLTPEQEQQVRQTYAADIALWESL